MRLLRSPGRLLSITIATSIHYSSAAGRSLTPKGTPLPQADLCSLDSRLSGKSQSIADIEQRMVKTCWQDLVYMLGSINSTPRIRTAAAEYQIRPASTGSLNATSQQERGASEHSLPRSAMPLTPRLDTSSLKSQTIAFLTV